MIKRDNLKCHLYVAGDGALRPWLEEQIKENYLENYITLLGNVINLVPVFKQCNLYISPSDLEGLPTVIVESLLEGIPVIATPITGTMDIYNHMAPQGSMILSKDTSAESLYECLKTVLTASPFKPFKLDIDKINSETLKRFEAFLGN